MKPRLCGILFLFFIATAFLNAQSSSFSQINGIWQNYSRFVEFSPEKGMRVVLKPYYGFVYEDRSPFPCAITEDPSSPGAGLYRLSIRYAGEKKDMTVPVALIGDSLYFRFYRKTVGAAGAADAVRADSAPGIPPGFYQAAGNADALRLYKTDPIPEFYCYYFEGNEYYRIRYWAADVRFKDIQAEFTSASGAALSVPKFIPIDDVLYTCITSTGRILRNYETGTYSVKDGFISFNPDSVVFEGTAAMVSKPLKLTFSADGRVLAFGEPYLVRSKVADLDAEIKAHNALRRPRRKPIFGFMNLDFHWDEIDRIRNGNRVN